MHLRETRVVTTCDAFERFTSFVAECLGSVHDSRIFKMSYIKGILEKTTNTVLADCGYAITPYLLTPYDKPTTLMQKYFNQVYATESHNWTCVWTNEDEISDSPLQDSDEIEQCWRHHLKLLHTSQCFQVFEWSTWFCRAGWQRYIWSWDL